VRLDEQGLDEYTDRFEHDAFRHEILDGYSVASDGDGFAAWRAGRLVDPELGRGYRDWIRAHRTRGATVRRLRTVLAVPSEYLRFEAEVFYTANTEAGEEIRIFDLTELDQPSDVTMPEFWMLDGQRAALMHYHPDGRFSHAETAEGGAARKLRTREEIV
jgi:hypothetical protein